MNRDEWILEHIPVVKTAVKFFYRRNRWLPSNQQEDMEGEAFLALTQQADRLIDLGVDLAEKTSAYAFRLAWYSCADYVKKHKRTFASYSFDPYSREKELFAGTCHSNRHLLYIRTFLLEFPEYKALMVDNPYGERLPMAEDMTPDEVAAIEAYVGRSATLSKWQHTKLKRRVLAALRTLGVSVDKRIATYSARTERRCAVHDRSESSRDKG